MKFNKEQKKEVCELLDKTIMFTLENCEINGCVISAMSNECLEQFKIQNGLLDEPLEVGVWYKSVNIGSESKALVYFDGAKDEGVSTGYGNGYAGSWSKGVHVLENDKLTKATRLEVKDALIKHWEKDNKGFERYDWEELDLAVLYGLNSDKITWVKLFDNGTWFPIDTKSDVQIQIDKLQLELDELKKLI